MNKLLNYYFLICALSFFALSACDSKKQLQPLSSSATILAFGDSLTEGVGVKLENSYPTVLQRLSNRMVVNAGISGETSAEGLARLPDVLAKTSPDLMILIEGGNDILQNKSHQQAKQNLAQMIRLAKDKGIQVVLIGVPEKQLFSDVAGFYRELADEESVVFDDDIISSLIRKPKYKSDSVHFNKAGYEKMAEGIYTLLKENGAL